MNDAKAVAAAVHPWLPAIRARLSRLDGPMACAYLAIGFSPITALALAIMGWLPLHVGAPALVLPAVALGVALGVRFPAHGRLALKGFAIGLIAVTFYDALRVPFVLAGAWGDFIPEIGKWLLNRPEPDFAVGYLYRYIGDGGGMGLAFVVAHAFLKPRLPVRPLAVAYGVAIWLCLLAMLLLAPHGQEMLFRLTPTSFTLSLLGHLIYGAVIGICLAPPRALLRRGATMSVTLPQVSSPATAL